MRQRSSFLICLVLFSAAFSAPQMAVGESGLQLEFRSRVRQGDTANFTIVQKTESWNAAKTAIIICDMWDDHTCKGAAQRVAEMAPAVNRAAKAARAQGVFVIHAPSGRMSYYKNAPQRRRAIEAPRAKAPVAIKWNHWNAKLEGEPLSNFVDGGCNCPQPCPNFIMDENGLRKWKRGGKLPWTRQIETIDINSLDAISDNGQEIFNLLEHRGIDNVIVMGVHTNICVCGRPFGLRQMVYFGKNVVLCRDLTDALFQYKSRDLDQFQGTEIVVEHIEKHICPTITSTALTSKPAFRFHGDTGRK
jgi:nicotinamidase-related amidase